MKKKLTFLLIAIFMLQCKISLAGEPMEIIKTISDNIVGILSNPDYKAKEKIEQKKSLIKSEINKIFDWEEFSKRSLAQNWQKLTPDQKREFIALYQKLLESVYANRMDEYSGEKLRYEAEEISGNNAIVKVMVIGYKGADVPLIYRLIKKDNKWYVYDVVIEGVSLVNNYRSQFNSIMMKSGYNGLRTAMREKIEGKGDTLK